MNEVNGSVSLLRGRALVIGAAVLWSTSGLFAKAPVFDTWPELERGPLLAFWRAVFASLILMLLVKKISWSWRMMPMLIAFAAMNWTYLSALVLCEPTKAIWLQYTAPAWAFLFGWWLFKETPNRRDWIMLGFVAVAIAVILSSGFTAQPLGIIYGVLSGICYAGVILMLRWNRDADAAWLAFINHAVTAVVFFPFLIGGQTWPTGGQWGYLAAFGMLQMGLPYWLLARALRDVSSHEASGLALLEPTLLPLWVWLAWRTADNYQLPDWTTLVGGGLILVGLLARYLRFAPKAVA